ncbi:MAG: HAMP domain-containing protein [Deltaproteobacteria bacterium]|jgi:two-component system sensor histidine kinase CpxA|nr:HAMP domain-containing protein [Deltaproteobacteria bacterium]
MILRQAKTRVNAMPLFWKAYIFIVTLLIFVVGLAECIFEPLAEDALEGIYGGFQPWHEAVIWAVSILIPSLACGCILSKILSDKLGKMAKASKALARGNLEVRLPENGNARDAFDVLANSFNEMADAIKTQQYNDRRLLADISHELRSPLTRMTVAADLLNLKHKDEESVEITLRLEKEIRQMNELISLLMGQARDKLLYSDIKKALNLEKILTELADDFSFQGEMRRIRMKATITAGLVVCGNALMLERMFGNILSNAIFYSPPDNIIELEAKRNGDTVSVVIRDFGPGVPEDQLEDIFRAFYRVDGSRARTSGGAGLGLALAREAAILSGGNIVARNAHPGLRVMITLPGYTSLISAGKSLLFNADISNDEE